MDPAEGVLDPWVADWFKTNPMPGRADGELTQEMRELGRGPVPPTPSTRQVHRITEEVVSGIPVRVYEHEGLPTGLIVYFHGGGFSIGSIGMMDNIARELAYGTGAAVVSVGYRLAPEDPYPAGLDDCERVTRAVLADPARFRVQPSQVAVAGESAGGNLAAAVALRLRDDGDMPLAAQILMYPVLDCGSADYPSRTTFDGLVLSSAALVEMWATYAGKRDIDRDPYAAPLQSDNLAGLPPALIVLAGCDPLRDEGRLYASRLRDAGVDVDDVCYPGQPHGFINLMFPAATDAFDRIGTWLRDVFYRAVTTPRP
jgi:acetyl esterase